PVYGESKSGLSYFLDAVAPELEGAGIAVTIVHPGFVKTPMTDQQPHRMPFMIDDVTAARAMADAIEGRRRWLRFPFIQNVIATGGAWLPRSLRHRIVSRSIRR
ncbi:MAG TPA: SDR family NAD(P)-dependent oxidoreductase, partial [Myxococcota bacterium]